MNTTITVKENQYLTDVSPTGHIRPWRVNKMQNLLLAMAYESIDSAKAARLRDCATDVAFVFDPVSKQKKLSSANFCRVRLCPICQWRRSLKVFGQTQRIMRAIEQDKPMAYIFVTFTMKNCSGAELSKNIDLMMTAWNRMTGLKKIKSAIKGYYRGLEITHNVDYDSPCYDTYHPHFHCVFAVNPSYFTDRTYLSQAAWTDIWQRSARLSYTPIVDVRRVKGNSATAVCEAAKYTVKVGDYLIPDDWDLTVDTVRLLDTVLNKRRLTAYGGIFGEWHHKLNLDDSEDGDLVHTDESYTDDVAAPKIWYAWRTGYSQYIRMTD